MLLAIRQKEESPK